MYVVLAKGRDTHGLEGVQGIKEVTTTEDGERLFIIQRDLKKD